MELSKLEKLAYDIALLAYWDPSPEKRQTICREASAHLRELEDVKLALRKAYSWYLQSVNCAPKEEFFEEVERLCDWKVKT